MTFFDKLFTIKNRNSKQKSENCITSEHLSFSSSHFTISKDQIRVLLFRECDRRGRKLLFDSSSVEKVPLGSLLRSSDCIYRRNSDQSNGGKISDLVEVANSHGYRYKKPCSDVMTLGEMIFGSVAMVYKGGNTCKIHSIPSPKRVMFTTVVYAPGRCHYHDASEKSLNVSSGVSSLTSLSETSYQNQTSSSDSKLYQHPETVHMCTSTYPSLKHNSSFSQLLNCCECSGRNDFTQDTMHSYSESDPNCCHSSKVFLESNRIDLGIPYKLFDIKNSDGPSSYGSSDSVIQSSDVSGSLSSLRRRWMHSYATSVDASSCDEIDSVPSKTRTKLGLSLVVDLSEPLQEEMEKFLFNHTIIIDSILNKLQSSVEMAYVKKDNFVDLIYTAFEECQQSMYELITGNQYERPLWLALVDDVAVEPFQVKSMRKQVHEDMRKQDTLNNKKLKFLESFCDILAKFDTKDTNFFISTLVTAVLTHHLSWVTSIADADVSASQQKLQCAIKHLRPYNPIWAQLNDLSGILGSPLRAAKTVITGAENNRNHIAAIIQILTYFIRCYNVVENSFDMDIGDITSVDLNFQSNQGKQTDDCENFDSGIDCTYVGASETNLGDNKLSSQRLKMPAENSVADLMCRSSAVETVNSVKVASVVKIHDSRHLSENSLQRSCVSEGLKRSKSCLSRLKSEITSKKSNQLYPSIDDLAKMENIRISDFPENDRTVFVENVLNPQKITEKIQKLIRVPNRAVVCHAEKNLSPDEGYDTVDSSNISEIFPKKIVNERQTTCLSPSKRTEEVLFVLGENEELVNLSKKVVMTRSAIIDVENEDSKSDVVISDGKVSLTRSQSMNIPVSCEDMSRKRCRTLESVFSDRDRDARTLWAKYEPFIEQLDTIVVDKATKTPWIRCELPLPSATKSKCCTKRLNVSSVLGGVNDQYNSQQIIQGVLEPKANWERTLRHDLSLCAHCPVLETELSEALCIVADMETWEVLLCSSRAYAVDKSRQSAVRVGMSQIVADMLESFLQLHRIKLPPEYCLYHIERKLHEIYSKSKSVAELLNTTELCNMEYLTSRLDIGVNDVPLLLSVATTHSPHITAKYGLSFT